MNRVDFPRTASTQFRPDTHHASVADVLQDRKLSNGEKRAILAAWASDMYAVDSSPGLRAIPGHDAPIRLNEILDALRALDEDDPPPQGGLALRMPAPRLRTNVQARRHDLWEDPDLRAAAIGTHRKNIRRYKRLLETELTDLEREFICRRMAEEKTAIEKLIATARGDDGRIAIAAGC